MIQQQWKILTSLAYIPCSWKLTARIFSSIRMFDRRVKCQQRDWAAKQPDFEVAQYLKDEVGYRVADKVCDLTDFYPVCLDIGSGVGNMTPHFYEDNIGCLIQVEISCEMLKRSKCSTVVPTLRILCDEELVPLRSESIDLIVSSLSAHWINDLPNWFKRCLNILRPDGVMFGAIITGDSLYELRCSLQLAESERLGGIGLHISPFVQPQDIGSLLKQAGFDMITLDTDKIVIRYPNMLALAYDLKLMAESSATIHRSAHLRRDILLGAEAIYQKLYADENGYPATFHILSFVGWRPGPNMPKPAKRGSQTISFKDLSAIMDSATPFPDH